MSEFRFSPNPNHADRINWLPWGAEAFAKAQQEDKPVLLSISAVWCYWCHIMDETSYSDPDVHQMLDKFFVPVRVDNDHHPEINARYNVGGWPTTAFLTPHGGLVGGATYLPPDQFLAMLGELQNAYRSDKPQLYSQARDLLDQRKKMVRRVAAGPTVDEGLVDRVARVVAGAYDASNGGFGHEPKFPTPGILRFITHLFRTSGEDFYGAMLRKSLDKLSGSRVWDEVDGGVYRHCAKADWSEPQHEKLLEDNVQLARSFLDGSVLFDNLAYRAAAAKTIDYVIGHLYDDQAKGFRGSQGAHSDYFGMTASQRQEGAAPPPDPSCYTATSAMAAAMLLDASWKLGRPGLIDTALGVVDRLDFAAQEGSLSHVYTAAGPSDASALFADWAWLLTALVQAHATTATQSYLDRAVHVASVMVDRFFDEAHGGFFDIEEDPEAVGHMQVREKPLLENSVAVLALLRLYQSTRNEDYRKVSEAALSAFVETYGDHGEFAAEYGLAVHVFKNDLVEVTVEGRPDSPGCQELLHAAVRLNSPNLDIKTVMADPGDATARAHVCLDTVCLPPVSAPGELEKAVAGIAGGPESPFQDIFQVFPGA